MRLITTRLVASRLTAGLDISSSYFADRTFARCAGVFPRNPFTCDNRCSTDVARLFDGIRADPNITIVSAMFSRRSVVSGSRYSARIRSGRAGKLSMNSLDRYASFGIGK